MQRKRSCSFRGSYRGKDVGQRRGEANIKTWIKGREDNLIAADYNSITTWCTVVRHKYTQSKLEVSVG